MISYIDHVERSLKQNFTPLTKTQFFKLAVKITCTPIATPKPKAL